jgi:hypothetical protein
MSELLETTRDFMIERQEDLAREMVSATGNSGPIWKNGMEKRGG